MGTKESLHDIVDSLSDEEATELLDIALTRFVEPGPLTDEDIAAVHRGLDDAANGRMYTTEEVLRYVLERRE
jgi:predicted transcriptional regulator